jgi:hypothetical protein
MVLRMAGGSFHLEWQFARPCTPPRFGLEERARSLLGSSVFGFMASVWGHDAITRCEDFSIQRSAGWNWLWRHRCRFRDFFVGRGDPRNSLKGTGRSGGFTTDLARSTSEAKLTSCSQAARNTQSPAIPPDAYNGSIGEVKLEDHGVLYLARRETCDMLDRSRMKPQTIHIRRPRVDL